MRSVVTQGVLVEEERMLLGFIQKAVTMGCDSIEIEYKDRKEG